MKLLLPRICLNLCTPFFHVPTKRLCGNGDLNLNTGLDVDDDLLNDLSGGVNVDQTLVDPIAILSVLIPSQMDFEILSLSRHRDRDVAVPGQTRDLEVHQRGNED